MPRIKFNYNMILNIITNFNKILPRYLNKRFISSYHIVRTYGDTDKSYKVVYCFTVLY